MQPPKFWRGPLIMNTVMIRQFYSGETNNKMLRIMSYRNGATFVPGSQCYQGHG